MTVPPHLHRMIRDRILAGHLEIGGHVLRHAFAQGFMPWDAREAALAGTIIEHYPERRRCLIAARVRPASGRLLWLHVVCEYNDPVMVGLTTAYVPDPAEWGDPPIRRRGT